MAVYNPSPGAHDVRPTGTCRPILFIRGLTYTGRWIEGDKRIGWGLTDGNHAAVYGLVDHLRKQEKIIRGKHVILFMNTMSLAMVQYLKKVDLYNCMTRLTKQAVIGDHVVEFI
jgi:hypothetical protein